MMEIFTHIIKTDVEYYSNGPQQARPPDGVLKKGTKIRDLGTAKGSYRHIETENGLQCFVESEAFELNELTKLKISQ